MELPASELLQWEAYFSIYPFTQDREDWRNAKLCAVIANMSGKTLKEPVDTATFMPEFENEPETAVQSLERQKAGFAAFKAGAKSMTKKRKHETRSS